jgi:phosphomannomutase/phosphoglucomutase
MKLGKKKSVSASTARKPKLRKASTSLESIFLSLFIGITVLIPAGAYSLFMFQQQELQDREATQGKALLQAQVQNVEQMINHYINSMELIAREPGLIQLMREGDKNAIHQRESLLAYMFPAAMRIKLLPPDVDQPDHTMTPPLSYACLDMLDRSRKGEATNVEVHLPGNQQQHIDIVRNISGDDTSSLGSLLVSIPVQTLKELIRVMPIGSGYMELQQTNEKGQVTALASRGNNELRRGSPGMQMPIRKSSWKIAYWPATASGNIFSNSNLVYWGVVVGVWLLLSIFIFILYRRLNKALLKDQVQVIKLVKDIQQGELARNYPVSLKNFQGAFEQLRMIAGQPFERPAATDSKLEVEAEPEAAPAESTPEEDIVGISFASSSDALEVRELGDESQANLPASIFRAYDIRGIAGKTLTPQIVRLIGRALGSEAQERGQQKIVVARDGRLSGDELAIALARGLQEAGRDVIDIGRVPTPVLYFASHYLGNGSGVMLTGSHNPPEYNGLKMLLRGETLHGDAILGLRKRIEEGRLISGEGSVQDIDVAPSYIERITSDVRLERPLKIVIDCGNGVAGEIAPQLYRALGCEVIEMYCDVDGTFPNHHPDPSKPENLIPLTRAVTENQADLGMAFDGDGDRLGVIDSSGKIIWPDRYLMLLATDVLIRQPGAMIIYDVKCTRALEQIITENGGQPLMWKTGHSYIKAKMIETGAQLAGEMSGHIFFKERWFGFDDALYAGARLLEILSGDHRESHQIFGDLPESVSTPELHVKLEEGEHFKLMEALKKSAKFPGARLITIDGLRVEFDDGWGLVRASNTTPSLVLRFEADNASALQQIQDHFRTQLLSIDPGLDLPF